MGLAIRCFKFLGLTVAILTAIVILGSIDQSSFDDRGLLSQEPIIPDEDNGFPIILYMQEEGYELLGEGFERGKLRAIAKGEWWDTEHATNLVEHHAAVISDIKRSANKPLMKMPAPENNFDFPSYVPLVDGLWLLITESKLFAEAGEYDKSIASIGEALKFSQAVKTDENGNMIGWLIGLAMQSHTLTWIHQLVDVHDLSSDEYLKILETMNEISPYNEDGFQKVFSGELRFVVGMLNEIKNITLKQRLDNYRENGGFLDEVTEDASGFKYKYYDFMSTLLPNYYLHTNQMSGVFADLLFDVKKEASNYCSNIELARGEWVRPQWYDFILPNSQSRLWPWQGGFHYADYFDRRCHFHIYADAVKAIVATKAYQESKGYMPETLNELVPEYLAQKPRDYFTGEPLKYSFDNQWMYSVGANGEDNGGSLLGVYTGKCKSNDACYDNPTIPVAYIKPQRDEVVAEPVGNSGSYEEAASEP
ncbi:MAG: hypothetical protein KBT63_03055 [Porticoccaceae bacterium]|nr:hypothetical protein [Porticoccaceae bacterium]